MAETACILACMHAYTAYKGMDMILTECVVKGYHECGFTVTAGKTFFRGEENW